ncbi:anti sigma factor C-terminal domain-containing protein [Ornithinibacillus scapharcae]|uniref:anti sigma factor C-terminal domain-containing protein n=1 Tax=Ornithinibacillus scapharcae TaxID=1147159 RepID=UPI0002DAD753|nr:anti sigma factor C-terminal domain-containing protein [Ornithinibacillus scapharcae]
MVSEILTVSNEERTVRYNQLNNEREIDFYYPHIGYHNLPNELEIALTLDENTLIEVALSFNKPMSKEEVWNSLGSDNVDWFWIDKSNSTTFNELPASEMDFDHVLFGKDAFGFSVSNDYPSLNSNNSEKNILISGAIVSGTPSELERFLELDIIRASVIGLTMDNY